MKNQIEQNTIPLYSEDGFEGTIEPINLELSDNLKYIIQLQEELQTKMDSSVLGVPVQYFGERNLTTEENKVLEIAFKKSLLKHPTLKGRK